MTGYFWTADRDVRLKVLYATKLSYTKIGLALGVSRNAISGRVMRMIAEGKLERIHNPALPPRISKPKSFIFGNGPKREKAPPKPIEVIPVVEPEPLRISMIALTDKQCKFAVSDAPYEFCGLPSKASSWLCEKHHVLCYQPNAPRRAA